MKARSLSRSARQAPRRNQGPEQDRPVEIELRAGLSLREVHGRLRQGLGLADTGQRILAFYLTEIEDRRLYQASGHASTKHYAEARLDVDRRRTTELIVVGRKLLELKHIDQAFCQQRIGWAKVLELVKVVSPEHEQAWLECALASTCRELKNEISRSRPGRPPRGTDDRRGLPEVFFPLHTRLDVLTQQTLDTAKQRLSNELGRAVDDAECLATLAEHFLATDTPEGALGRDGRRRRRIDRSLYRVIVRLDPEDAERMQTCIDGFGWVSIDGDDEDPVTSRVRSEMLRCDAEYVRIADVGDAQPAGSRDRSSEGAPGASPSKGNGRAANSRQVPPAERDVKTPRALRERVIARDGRRCRACGLQRRLMVHHVHYRSRGGPTDAANLATVCTPCHALVHADLLKIVPGPDGELRFLDRDGRDVNAMNPPEACASGARRLRLLPPVAAGDAQAAREPLTLKGLPARVDGAWWRRHAACLRFGRDGGLELRPGALPHVDADAGEGDDATARGKRQPLAAACAGIVGQDALLERLDVTARGSAGLARPFPHTLFVGPAGTGKSTLCRAIAASQGARLHTALGSVLHDPRELIGLLAGLRPGDVLFIDEIHALPRRLQEMLYDAMAERCLHLTVRDASQARTITLDVPAFTLLAATTSDGSLPDPLLSRFGLRESLGYYEVGDLARIVSVRSAAKGFALGAEAARRLALAARGTPREAARLLDRVIDGAVAIGRDAIDEPTVEATLARLGRDAYGLEGRERRYLDVLLTSGEPVALSRLAHCLGTDSPSLARQVEPHLFCRGLVRITVRGRCLTAAGRRVLETRAAQGPDRDLRLMPNVRRMPRDRPQRE